MRNAIEWNHLKGLKELNVPVVNAISLFDFMVKNSYVVGQKPP